MLETLVQKLLLLQYLDLLRLVELVRALNVALIDDLLPA